LAKVGNCAHPIRLHGTSTTIAASASAPVFFSDDRLLMDSESALERCEYFHVHRMLHKALDIRLAGESA